MGGEAEEAQRNLVDSLVAFIGHHPEFYSHVEFGLCLSRVQERPCLVLGKISPIPRLDQVLPEESLDYGHVILTRFHVPLDEFEEPFREALLDRRIEHPIFGLVEFEGKLEAYGERPFSSYRRESRKEYEYAAPRWPFYSGSLRLERQTPRPTGALVRPGLPLYPNWNTGAHSFLEVGETSGRVSDIHELMVVVPDPRARIEQLLLEGERVQVVLGEGEYDYQDLLLKLYASNGDSTESDEELSFEDSTITQRFPFEPKVLSAHVVAKGAGDDLDFRDFDLSWGHLPAGVKVRKTEGELLELLRRGEGPNVEYKQKEDPTFPQKLARTVGAFSNSDGGVLFLGVNDEGVPVQSVALNEAERIRNIVTSHIDPTPEGLEFHPLDFDDIEILAVAVEEGTSKPYVVRDQGVFIRRGATSRHPTRSELLALLEKSKSVYGT